MQAKSPSEGTGVAGAREAGGWTGSTYEIGRQVPCFHGRESVPLVGECKWKNGGEKMNVISCRNHCVTGWGIPVNNER